MKDIEREEELIIVAELCDIDNKMHIKVGGGKQCQVFEHNAVVEYMLCCYVVCEGGGQSRPCGPCNDPGDGHDVYCILFLIECNIRWRARRKCR